MCKQFRVAVFTAVLISLLQACAAPAPPMCEGSSKRPINGRTAAGNSSEKLSEAKDGSCQRA